MSKFCTKCGKKIEEGKVCECSKTNKNEDIKKNMSVEVKKSCLDCVNVFKKIFTKPFDAIKEFVCENKFIAGIIMIVVAAITSGLYKIASLKSMYSSSNMSSFNKEDISSLLSSAFSGNLSTEPQYLKEFFTTFATNLAEYALIVVIGYFIIAKLLKGKATWKNMITAVAISLSVVLAANIINSILVFIDGEFIGNIRNYVSSLASILSVLILYGSINEFGKIDKNKLFITVASMLVAATLVMDVIQKIFN